MDNAIVVEGVSKKFRMYRDRNQSLKQTILQRRRARYDDYWALRDVSFEIPLGTTFGLIGENGSGKSTLLKCIARILRPNEGAIRTQGSLAALLELGSVPVAITNGGSYKAAVATMTPVPRFLSTGAGMHSTWVRLSLPTAPS